MKELWKKFDEIELTHSSVHHLMAMHALLGRHGYVRGVDIARYLNISRSSVSITLRKLINRGYVEEDENKFFRFTEKGKRLVDSVLSKRRIIRDFFEKVLKLDPQLAEAEACKIEHLLEEETGQRLLTFMGLFLSNHQEAKAFQEKYNWFRLECNKYEGCEVCDMECYFAGKKTGLS